MYNEYASAYETEDMFHSLSPKTCFCLAEIKLYIFNKVGHRWRKISRLNSTGYEGYM